MERNKRQTKPPQIYVIHKACYPRIRKKKDKKKILERAQYQVIPTPMKFICIAESFALYAVNEILLIFLFLFHLEIFLIKPE